MNKQWKCKTNIIHFHCIETNIYIMLDNEYIISLIYNAVFHVAKMIWVSEDKTTIEVNYYFFVE